jgi:hypothetical protein
MELAQSYPVTGLGMGAVESWGSATTASAASRLARRIRISNINMF